MKSLQIAPLPTFQLGGAHVYKALLSRAEQEAMVKVVRNIVHNAPFFSPETPYEKKMSVQMTSAGRFGWVSDKSGYRYQEKHPSGKNWAKIPAQARAIWHAVSGVARNPECCLVNFYDEAARMGMHQDKDEADFSYPVVSISLGDSALFRIGGTSRGGKTLTHWLESGDVVVLSGPARLAYHGIDKIRLGSSTLLKNHGRINLTLRVVQ